MTDKTRGQETKLRVLEEACKVFAEKGYRDATHAEICRRAGTNIAAINYYFSSKEILYQSVFDHLAAKEDALYPLCGNLPEDAPPENRLRAFIHAHLNRAFSPEPHSSLHSIHMSEMFDPTGLLKERMGKQLAKNRAPILRLLRDLLGPDAAQRDIEWCEMSIVSQCFMAAAPGPQEDGPRVLFGLTPENIDDITDHILRFSLAGIKAQREAIHKHITK